METLFHVLRTYTLTIFRFCYDGILDVYYRYLLGHYQVETLAPRSNVARIKCNANSEEVAAYVPIRDDGGGGGLSQAPLRVYIYLKEEPEKCHELYPHPLTGLQIPLRPVDFGASKIVIHNVRTDDTTEYTGEQVFYF